MKIKAVVDEDFSNYKKPSMFICAVSCGGKCCIEAGIPLSVCHNDGWRSRAPIEISAQKLCRRYLKNTITQAVVFGGLEPFEQFGDVIEFIKTLRIGFGCNDDVIVYTGYRRSEIEREIEILKEYGNVTVKFGRFVPGEEPHFDNVLGVELANNEQYAQRIG